MIFFSNYFLKQNFCITSSTFVDHYIWEKNSFSEVLTENSAEMSQGWRPGPTSTSSARIATSALYNLPVIKKKPQTWVNPLWNHLSLGQIVPDFLLESARSARVS